MNKYSLAHLSDSALVAGAHSLVARDRANTSELLAHLAEVDARRLYAVAGYPSMFAWCVGHLGLSEDSAAKRIQAARTARRFPAVFEMVTDGGLHLSAISLLAPRLTPENASELLTVSAHKSKQAIERLLAERFPLPDLDALLAPAANAPRATAPAAADVQVLSPEHAPGHMNICTQTPEPTPAPQPVSTSAHSRVAPLAPGRFGLQVTLSEDTHDKLRYAQSLLGHSVPDGDLAQVLDRALDALVARLERQRFGKCSRARTNVRRAKNDPRHIPAAVRRMVWERDGGQCTFTSEHGHRCESRTRLEFDHIEPIARGGASTPGNLRLRCRAHNQHAAERTFGREFMAHQREAAQRRAAAERETRRAAEQARLTAERERLAELQARRDELIPFLRQLGYSLPASRLASAVCDSMPDASLEDRLRAALKSLMPSSVRIERPPASSLA